MPFPVDRVQAPDAKVTDLLTLSQVAEQLGVQAKRVYVLVQEGKLHPVRPPDGKRTFYLPWEVDAVSQRHLFVRVA